MNKKKLKPISVHQRHRDRTNDERRLVPARLIGARAEEGMNDIREAVGECIDEHLSVHVIEGHLSLITVYVDPYTVWFVVEAQRCRRFRSERVVVLIPETQEPVAVGGAYYDLPFPVDGVASHAQVPVRLPTHLHLPVMASRREGLAPEDADHTVKALGAVRHGLVAVPAAHLLAVVGDEQAWVGGEGVQGYVHCIFLHSPHLWFWISSH